MTDEDRLLPILLRRTNRLLTIIAVATLAIALVDGAYSWRHRRVFK